MPKYLLDTNTLSDLMADHPKVLSRATKHRSHVVTSVIVRGELVDGLTRLPVGKKRTHLTKRAAALFKRLRLERVTKSVADRYGQVKGNLAKSGITLQDNDLWIAATALILGAVLVTRDQGFTPVPGLILEDWTR